MNYINQFHNFKTRKVIVHNIDEIWSADLVDMQSFSRTNKDINIY